jgi:hypothetical protein
VRVIAADGRPDVARGAKVFWLGRARAVDPYGAMVPAPLRHSRHKIAIWQYGPPWRGSSDRRNPPECGTEPSVVGRAANVNAQRPYLRGICLVVKGDQPPPIRPAGPSGITTKAARRPNLSALSQAIPLFFIARNRFGLWVAREAEGRTGGVFLFKRSAVRFAERNGSSCGCATMFPAARMELEIQNRGNRLICWIAAALFDAFEKWKKQT